MKGYVTLILCMLFAWAGTQVKEPGVSHAVSCQPAVSFSWEDMQVQPMHNDVIAPFDNRKMADMEWGDVHGLAYRFHVSLERTYRFVSVETNLTIKRLLRRMASYAAMQAGFFADSYTTSPALSWQDPCEYYIFRMRRILI